MILERQQHGEVKSVFEFNYSNGQHGDGVYFHLPCSKVMRKYYSRNGEKSYRVKIEDNFVLDCSKKTLDYWEAKEVIFKNPDKKAFIFKHTGCNIPTSREILITDITKIILL